jgi:putative ABC transport system permease protein
MNSKVPRSLRSWLWGVDITQEVDEEIGFHVEMRTRELVERGVDPRIAREMVLARLGDVGRLKRTCIDLGRKREREMRLTRWLEEFRSDVTTALRQMKASPGFTLVAALTLALGIGANSAIFALADATFLRPLPFSASHDRLVMVWERFSNGFLNQVTPLDFGDWAEQNQSFDAMASFLSSSVAMIGPDGTAEQVTSHVVTAQFFDLLGVTPIAGRTFLPSDADSPNTVILAEGFWRRRFGADPALVGRSIVIAGRPQTVIGIVPDRFQVIPATVSNAGSEPPGLWTVFNSPRADPSLRRAHYLYVVGRIKEGVTFEAAQRDMTAIGNRNAELYPETNTGHIPALQPLRDALVGSEMRLTSMLLLAVVGFVLLMCCANVANLLLARTMARARELAVRSALGASRRRIVSQILTESLVLALAGGLIGMAVGAAILELTPSLVPPGLLPSAVTLTFDARVAVFCAVASLTVGLLFGLVPAWQVTGASVVQAMSTESRSTTRGGKFRSGLVVAEVAAAVLVLCGAGLLLRTLISLQSLDPGSRAQDVLTMTLNLPFPGGRTPTRYESQDQVHRFYDSVEKEVAQIPGVRSAAIGSVLPLDGTWIGQFFDLEGDPPSQDGRRNFAQHLMVGPTYFETLDIPIVSGRAFTVADGRDGVQVCIVSEAFVRRYLNGRNPLGMRVAIPNMSLPIGIPVLREIVGVARQVRMRANEREPPPQLYVPTAQNSWFIASLSVRPQTGPAEALLPAVRAAVARVDKEQPVTRVRTIDVVAAEATSRQRFRAVLVGLFAALALGLAMVGVFGVLAYSVQQRIREFGVRIAMGARGSDVMRLVLGSAARLTMVGLAIGLIGAAALSRYVATLVYPVRPLDPITFIAVPAVLIVTAAIAVAVPAWRAARVDPVVAFRSE